MQNNRAFSPVWLLVFAFAFLSSFFFRLNAALYVWTMVWETPELAKSQGTYFTVGMIESAAILVLDAALAIVAIVLFIKALRKQASD